MIFSCIEWKTITRIVVHIPDTYCLEVIPVS
jgi:hypothetical protein